jgi:hypothetical protein
LTLVAALWRLRSGEEQDKVRSTRGGANVRKADL